MDLLSLEGEDLLAKGVISVPGVVKDVCVTEHLNPERAASCNQAPELHYSLVYDRQKAELRVTLLEGKGQRSSTGGSPSGGYKASTDFIERSPPAFKINMRPQDHWMFHWFRACRI